MDDVRTGIEGDILSMTMQMNRISSFVFGLCQESAWNADDIRMNSGADEFSVCSVFLCGFRG